MQKTNMKKIMVALDYDPTAEKIAFTAHKIAKALNAQLLMIHVVADAAYYSEIAYSPIMGFNGFLYPGIDEMLEKELLQDSKEYLDKWKQHFADDSIQTIVAEGDFTEAVIQTAKEENVDMLVIGTHSRRGLGKLIGGSIAESLLKEITIPVLVIPNKEE